jgi:hypothetical protein
MFPGMPQDGPMPGEEPMGEIPPELAAILQDPMMMAALQRLMASQTGLRGLPPPGEAAPAGSPEGMAMDPDQGHDGEESVASAAGQGGPPMAGSRPHGAPQAMMAAAKKRAAGKQEGGRAPPPRR